jgi:hypothetical protein
MTTLLIVVTLLTSSNDLGVNPSPKNPGARFADEQTGEHMSIPPRRDDVSVARQAAEWCVIRRDSLHPAA